MDRWNRNFNIVGVSIFGVLGLAALAGVMFAGATHQLFMVGICAAMVAVLADDIRREEKKTKSKNRIR